MANKFVNDAAEFDSTAGVAPHTDHATGVSGLFASIWDRLTLSRQRRVDSEVGRFLEAHGGQLTDDLERQISRKFGNQAGQW
jgi:hypothetical protein